MGWRMRKSIRLGGGVRLNLSKSGVGVSAGAKGLRVGTGPRGSYVSAGIPGTGIRYEQRLGSNASRTTASSVPVTASAGLPGDTAIGCGVALGILGTMVLLVSVGTGICLLAVGVVLYFAGSSSPARGQARIQRDAISKVEAACSLSDQGDHEGAMRLLREAQPDCPTHLHPTLYYLMGCVSGKAQRHQPAVEFLEKAQSLGADEPAIPMLLGASYYEIGQKQRAIASLQSVTEDNPYFLTALGLLGEVLHEAGAYEEAIAALQHAPLLKRNLDDDLLKIHYCLGACYESLGNKRKAVQHYRRVYTQDAGYRDVSQRLPMLQ